MSFFGYKIILICAKEMERKRVAEDLQTFFNCNAAHLSFIETIATVCRSSASANCSFSLISFVDMFTRGLTCYFSSLLFPSEGSAANSRSLSAISFSRLFTL